MPIFTIEQYMLLFYRWMCSSPNYREPLQKSWRGGTEIWCSCSFFSNSQINRHRLNWYRYYDNFVIVVLETSLDSYSLQCLICLRLCVQWKISGVKCIFPLFPVYSHLDYVLHPLMHICMYVCMYVCGQKQHHYVGDGAEEEL